MGKTVTLEIPDDVYRSLEHDATARGQDVQEVAVQCLAARFGHAPTLTSDEKRAAMDRLLRFAGAFASGDPKSSDNERIDADLTREFGNGRKEP